MADRSRADELERYDLCIVGIGGGWPDLDHHPDGEHCKAERAVTIIRDLEDRIATMEDAAGPLVSDLHREMDRRMLAEGVTHDLVDAKIRLTKERDDARRKCLEHLSDADKRKAAFELDWRELYDKVEE